VQLGPTPRDLTEEECWQLLQAGGVARVAITLGAMPRIVAVRYLVDGSRLVISPGARHDLARAFDGTVVTVAADSLSDATEHGWFVEASGTARLERADEWPRRRAGPAGVVVASIEPAVVSGTTYCLDI
jgi:nitroimidazol reductase NimA-like FMN-containing flavoprotein (pyridoxamine 5'-phosphate oxidase superfamily)